MKGWSTEEMKDKANSLSEEDTEEMRKWRGVSQEEMDQTTNWREKLRVKYKVEDSQREAFKGRDAPLEWRRVCRSKKYRIKSGR